jgi:hypothetical protein
MLAKIGVAALVLCVVGLAIAMPTGNLAIFYFAALLFVSGAAVLTVAALAAMASNRSDGGDVMYDAGKRRSR